MFGVRLFLANCCFFALAVAPAQADPLPECPNTFDSPPRSNAECQIQSGDLLGLRFEKRTVDARHVEVFVFDHSSTAAVVLDEKIDGSPDSGVLLLRDLDGDGLEDVLVSLHDTGAHGLNSDWALWRATGDQRLFQRSGTIYGNTFWYAGDGWTAAYASGGGWGVSFYQLEDGQLSPVAEVGRSNGDSNTPPTSCHLLTFHDLARHGLTAATAEQKFCALAEQQPR
ncbi:hypothetical protein [Segniliparus rugosus]|uniref:FG-GAP repeat protein n=1 Tax=Segniliparus rugosus (strain ATCC BAA-974 / DSM 45345 / CCUG 50838 / CIP 108380 / JCM 13579 / CDC 945) TaxID=679197 RepID=E5XSL5_SEGRC|nr:hypothetical protein [Segniliparus rugosus]EFV12692.2 hypothetical protein HMPREF9336_02487 [Segniliparus rugosus ATCC BAA-974]